LSIEAIPIHGKPYSTQNAQPIIGREGRITIASLRSPAGGFPADRKGYRVIHAQTCIVKSEHLYEDDAIAAANAAGLMYAVTNEQGDIVYAMKHRAE